MDLLLAFFIGLIIGFFTRVVKKDRIERNVSSTSGTKGEFKLTGDFKQDVRTGTITN